MTDDDLDDYFAYDPETGVIRFKRDIKWAARGRAGAIAGGHNGIGYWRIRFRNKGYPAHRLAWRLMTGAWPPNDIDHINGDGLDNRWCNLRLADDCQNAWNIAHTERTNKTGVKGVRKDGNRYAAQISVMRKKINLGSFATAEEAGAAYTAAVLRYHGSYSYLNRPLIPQEDKP